MNFILKGVCQDSTIKKLEGSSLVSDIGFDFRPKSFNFVQSYKVQELVKQCSEIKSFSLIFEDEKDFVVTEKFKEVSNVLIEDQSLYLEFAGTQMLESFEKLQIPYFWHYQDQEKISNIKNTSFLKKIIFRHSDLEYLNSKGELFGFFQLFSDHFDRIQFEIQIDWNTELILSILEFINIPIFSIEITNIVEKSYQRPDNDLIYDYIKNVIQSIQQIKGK